MSVPGGIADAGLQVNNRQRQVVGCAWFGISYFATDDGLRTIVFIRLTKKWSNFIIWYLNFASKRRLGLTGFFSF
ncbi:hypothetical protein D1BOALGB6SA_8410 [Olavius sp. associated proteobacterium Delta 1]|nr:hypothetical protein D1BOALGB6SA_8410 [Olavius sp. associated proteobacterium Delta 1]